MKVLSIKQIIGIIVVFVLVAGLAVGVYLVQRQQTIKSKASAGSFVNALEINDQDGKPIQCDSTTNPPTCTTGTLDVTVKMKDKTLLLP